MAEVFLAVAGAATTSFAKLVVVKKLREHLASDMDFVAMLVDEARIAARLNHPNLVQTIEIGEEDGEYFLAMEYLDGQPLNRIVHRSKDQMPLKVHLAILSEVLQGIHYAHELADFDGTPLNIVHRDVTPHNCFVTYQGQTKVVDFGIAKASGRISETRHGVVKGKTAYMAPEQALGRDIDRRVDVFAVGVMTYEAAIHGRMWKGVSETDIVRRLLSGNIPSSPRAIVPTIDEELDQICRRALAFDANDRYPTAAAFQKDLDAYLARVGRPTPNEIGAFVASVFSETRAKMAAIVEKQLASVKAELAMKPATSRMSMTSATEVSSASASEPRRGRQSHTELMPAAPPLPGQAPPQPRPARAAPAMAFAPTIPAPRPDLVTTFRANAKTLLPLVVATVVLAIATTLMTIIAVPALVASPSTTPSGVASAGTMTITLRATPLETKFSIDDGPPQDNPFIGHFPIDSKQHRIRASAPSYVTQNVTAAFEKDISLRLTLAPVRSSAPPQPTAPK